MTMNDVTPTKVSEPRERLLATAADLFYRDGIHSVGVDRIVAAANVTRATFYRHFPGKEDLVNAYLNLEDATIRGFFANIPEGATPEQILEGIIEGIANDITYNHTRGCPFINAAAEYPDATSEVRKTVTRHREWFRQSLQSALEAAGRDDAAGRARTLVLLRDAALVGGYLDGVDTIRDTFMTAARATAALPA